MKYARAAWSMFLVRIARGLHLPQRIVWELEDWSSVLRFACALDFEPVQVTAAPAGYRCEHMSVTIGGDAHMVGAPTAWCGCKMQPVFR